MSINHKINKNLQDITGEKNLLIKNFLPIYRNGEFKDVKQPDLEATQRSVLFVGRIEKNKGVFDVLKIAQRFFAENRVDIRFDICGEGSQLDKLKRAAIEAKVESFFICHGHCKKEQMYERLSESHILIVPTRKGFLEGTNKVVIEGVMAGRPVVTSPTSQSLSYVSNAVVEVLPEDVEAYGDAILKLCDDRSFYREKQKSCYQYQQNFYDLSRSWGATLKSVIENWQKQNTVASHGV